jgi:hypothetical protein
VDAVSAVLRLGELPAVFGRPVRVGSYAFGLMVRRDLDVTVIFLRLALRTLEVVAGIGAQPAQHRRVRQIGFGSVTIPASGTPIRATQSGSTWV